MKIKTNELAGKALDCDCTTSIDEAYIQAKLDLCRRFIELCGENYTETRDGIYLRMAREAEQDCIYWQSMQAGNSHEEAFEMAYGKLK